MAQKLTLSVQTADHPSAGTNETVFVTLYFAKGVAGPFELDQSFHDDFRVGALDSYPIEVPDGLGDAVALVFRLGTSDDNKAHNWLLDHAQLEGQGRTWFFPCYGWVVGGRVRIVFEASARVPSAARSKEEVELRHQEIANRRTLYPWRPGDGSLPGSLDVGKHQPLPADEEYRGLLDNSYQVVFAKTLAAMKLTSGVFSGAFKSYDDFMELFRVFEVPSVHERWKQDHEAGREPVQGISPIHIRAMSAPPPGMDLSTVDLAFHLDAGMTLERAFAERRIFGLDFAALTEVPMFQSTDEHGNVERRYAPPARALYYRENAGALRPLVIQLGSDPLTCPLFTPSDSDADWIAAKAYLACAEGNIHQIIAHALRAHFAMEPIIMATMRNLSSAHPLYKLLRRHCRYTLAINEGARETLLAPGGVFDMFMATGGPDQGHVKLLSAAWRRWVMDDNHLPHDLERRGVDAVDALPYYPFRDDALPLWHSIHSYVRDTVQLYYADDSSIVADVELQMFWNDLITNGMPIEKTGLQAMDSIAGLVNLLTIFIYSVSVHHAAVNYAQYDHYAWVPNAPLCMRAPPPMQKGVLDEGQVVAALPSRDQSTWQVAIGRALASVGDDEEYLLSEKAWRDRYFVEPEALEIAARFQREMVVQEDRVATANDGRPSRYELLRPGRVPTSITI